jgi:hypothetical protein
MIRINLYKESIKNYIKNSDIKDLVNLNSNFIFPITNLTLMNNMQRKSGNRDFQHIYDIAIGIEIFYNYMINNNNNNNNDLFINQSIINQYSLNLLQLNSLINIGKYMNVFKLINNKFNIINENKNLFDKLNNQNLDTTNFKNIIINNKNIKQIPKKILISHINNTFGELSELTFILSMYLGGYTTDITQNFKLLGTYFGIINKIMFDIQNYENISNSLKNNDFSDNYIINYGYQDTFEFYLENKQKFIEGLLTLELMSNTMKEIIKYMDNIINNLLSNASITPTSI